MGNIYVDEANQIRLNNISAYFMKHADRRLRCRHISPNFVISFIFAKLINEENLIKKIENARLKE